MRMRITATAINIILVVVNVSSLSLLFPPVKNKNNIASIVDKNTSTIMSRFTKEDEEQNDNILSFSGSFCFENTNKISMDNLKNNTRTTCRGNYQEQEEEQKQQETVLLILNYPIPESSPIFDRLWQMSSFRIAADGGANRLYEYSKEFIPDRIRGDLDSLKRHVQSYYEDQHNVTIEQDLCQDTNDLDKVLEVCQCDFTNINDDIIADDNNNYDVHTDIRRGVGHRRRIIIYGAFGGRFDQEMASFAALYKWSPKQNHQIYLYSDETFAFLIPANRKCEIRLPFYNNIDHIIGQNHTNSDNEVDDNNSKIIIGEGPTCGLIPLGCRCESITTTGLKWDLDGTTPLCFGGVVSSSNRMMKSRVELVSSHPIIFTAEVIVVQHQMGGEKSG